MDEGQRMEIWKKDTDEFYRAVGEFVVKFELVCSAIQGCITFILHMAGLQQQNITQVLLAGATAEPLRTLLESLVAETQKLNKNEQKILKNALNRFQTLTSQRNDMIHSTWYVGYGNENTTDFSEASGIKYHKNKDGVATKLLTKKADDFHCLSKEAESLASIFSRLNGCFMLGSSIEKNFVVAANGQVAIPPIPVTVSQT